MPRKPKNKNLNRKFKIFVKVLDEDGFYDESKFGWLKLNPKTEILPYQLSQAHEFTEKEHGHGSFEDWKEFFEDEHKDWIVTAKYL